MFRHCIFCDAPFPHLRLAEHFPHATRVAYDPLRMRLWAICDACHRWTLSPLEIRFEVIAELDRAIRDRGRILATTAHVALIQVDTLTVVRVGRAGTAEVAWWRYGRELLRRHERLNSRGVRWGAYGVAAVARVGQSLGFAPVELDPARADSTVTSIIRLRFGSSAWEGRATCPFCRSVLLNVPFDFTWWLHPRVADSGLEVWVPCTRCDPWTPDNAYRLAGDDARLLLRRALAYQNVGGASERQIDEAAHRIDAAGAPDRLIHEVSHTRLSLWSLGKAGTLAFEIALSDSVEAELLRAQVRELEAAWRAEAPIADIIDDELAGP